MKTCFMSKAIVVTAFFFMLMDVLYSGEFAKQPPSFGILENSILVLLGLGLQLNSLYATFGLLAIILTPLALVKSVNTVVKHLK